MTDTLELVKQDLLAVLTRYKKWYWKLLHCFIYFSEYKLLLSMIDKVSTRGIDTDVHLILNSVSNELEKNTTEATDSPRKMLINLVNPEENPSQATALALTCQLPNKASSHSSDFTLSSKPSLKNSTSSQNMGNVQKGQSTKESGSELVSYLS